MPDRPTRPSLFVFAFAVAILFATFRAAQTGFWHPEDFGWSVAWFGGAFGISLLLGWGVTSAPVEVSTMLTDLQAQATEREKLKRDAKTYATPSGTAAGAAQTVIENDHDAIIRAFYERAFRNAKEFGGIGWRKGFETVMDDVADWRLWVKEPLIRAGLAIPVNYGNSQGAIWRDGINADVALGWLTSNLPPCPEAPPPNMRNASLTHSENGLKQDLTKETS